MGRLREGWHRVYMRMYIRTVLLHVRAHIRQVLLPDSQGKTKRSSVTSEAGHLSRYPDRDATHAYNRSIARSHAIYPSDLIDETRGPSSLLGADDESRLCVFYVHTFSSLFRALFRTSPVSLSIYLRSVTASRSSSSSSSRAHLPPKDRSASSLFPLFRSRIWPLFFSFSLSFLPRLYYRPAQAERLH